MDEGDAFARLENTHRRIEQRLATLEQSASDVDDPARRKEALEDVRGVMGFLARGAVRHHEDEELSLFPRLRAVSALTALVATLEEEHRLHESVRAELMALLNGFPEAGPDRAGEVRLRELARRLSDVYCAHIQREERELFPAARAALPSSVIEEMGAEMIARRADRGQGDQPK